jgi:hypothetical protein
VSSVQVSTATRRPEPGASAAPICVVATSVAATCEAIVTASALAQPFEGRVQVIAARPTPAEWSFDRQSAPVRALAKEIKRLTSEVEARIDVLPCVCSRMTDVTQLLPARAIVIIAGPSHRWWPTREQRLAHDLNELGHRVMFLHTSKHQPRRRVHGVLTRGAAEFLRKGQVVDCCGNEL